MVLTELTKSAGWTWVVGLIFLILCAGCMESGSNTMSPARPDRLTPRGGSPSVDHEVQSPPSDVAPSRHPQETSTAAPVASVEPMREPLFVDWPEPQWALLVTGRQRGYLEPCGCAGLENQKGGLMRRQTLIDRLANRGWRVVSVDVGNQVRRIGEQAEVKFDYSVEALRLMQYAAVGFGPDDLRLSATHLVKAITDDEFQPQLFASANVSLFDESFTSLYRIATVGGRRVGITSVLASDHQQKVASTDILMKPPEVGLREIWPKLEQQNCDVHILLAYASLEESRRLARAFPQFDIVVTAGGADEPNPNLELVSETDSVMIQTGSKGMYAFVIGVFDDSDQRFLAQRVPLDARFADAPQTVELFQRYQTQLEQMGLEGLGLLNSAGKGTRHPSGATFLGATNCRECHSAEFDVWSAGVQGQDAVGPHAHATRSLRHPIGRTTIGRLHDPECLSCHVTGWNAQEFFPYDSGFVGERESPLLVANGCENCHGPASLHVASEHSSDDDVERERLREQLRLKLPRAEQMCLKCHDSDNSPDFHQPDAFGAYWKRIAH